LFKKIVFHRLLKEQEVLLNYLVEQKSAVINGAAGTGKTMMAVEEVTRYAFNGERVLFLCYNVMLRDYLDREYHHEYIEYMTIDKFACKVAKTEKPDYRTAGIRILDMYISGSFRYKHVIVDEGQDFGREEIEEADLLQTIYDVVLDNEEAGGTFYVFYDKLQLIQAKNIPKFISDADCKLTLYKNCRNTENIAITSLKTISDRNPKLYDGAIKGVPARIHYKENSEEVINCITSIIEKLNEEGITDVTILTCKSEAVSILNNACINGTFKKKVFTTCRKYKGLEADAIIMVDVDEKTFGSEAVQRFYVGASRARLRLEIVTTMTDTECESVLLNVVKYKKKIKNAKREMASAFNSMPIV
jgi:nuclease-related domain protein